MGAERDDDLTSPIVLFQECIYRHGHISPPVGIAYENYVIVLDLDIALYGRTCFLCLLLFGYLNHFIV